MRINNNVSDDFQYYNNLGFIKILNFGGPNGTQELANNIANEIKKGVVIPSQRWSRNEILNEENVLCTKQLTKTII